MDISYKFILDRRRKNKDDNYPLKLRVYYNRGYKERGTGIILNEKAWNERQQVILPNDTNFKKNSFLLNALKARIDKIMLLAEDEPESLTSESLLKQLEKKARKQSDVKLLEYGASLIIGLKKSNRAGTALAYNDAINSLTNYGGKNLLIKDITYKLLVNYYNHMLSKGVKVNSIGAYLRSIRAIYNKAIKEGIAELQFYPFNKFKIETEETFSRTLTISEFKKILDAKVSPVLPAWHHRNYFMLSFYLIGINFTDLFTLTKDDISDGCIRYRRDKTGKLYNIKMPIQAKETFTFYANYKSRNGHRYLLPELQFTNDGTLQKRWIKQIVKSNNYYMRDIAENAGIKKKVSTYYARYTWANIAKQIGYSKDIIAEALGHEYGNRVTGIYLDNYDTEAINEVNEKVIETILHFKLP